MKQIIAILSVALMALAMHSCSKEPSYMVDDNYTAGDNYTADNEIAAAVRSHVSAKYSVHNNRYFYIININSTLSSAYPGKHITYGIDCGYGAYCHSKPESSSPTSSFLIPWAVCEAGSYTVGPMYNNMYIWNFRPNGEPGNETYVLKNAGVSNPSEAMADCVTFMRVFYALQEKIDSGSTLTTDERQQYNDSKRYIEEAGVSLMKSVLSIRVYCMVDGKKYIVGYIGYPATNGN